MNNDNIRPPKWASKFLAWYCRPELVEEIEGDLYEIFEKRVALIGVKKARRNFVWNVLRSFRPSTIRNLNVGSTMLLRSNLKVAWRQMSKRKHLTAIKVGGFALGMVPCIIIGLFVKYESGFDQQHEKSDRTFRVVQHTQFPEQTMYWNTTAYPLAAALRQDFQDVELITQTAGPLSRILSVEDPQGNLQLYEEKSVLFADSLFHEVFDLTWIAGSEKSALLDKNSIVLTESTAKKYYGTHAGDATSILGKLISMEGGEPLAVTGIIEDPPGNTTLRYDLIIPYAFFREGNQYFANNWSGNYQGSTFLVLKDPSHASDLIARIHSWKKKYLKPEDDQRISYHLQPLTEMHTETLYGGAPGSYVMPSKVLKFSSMAAIFILFISVVNFINVVTAQSTTRSKEIGVRKIVGGTRVGLTKQFITENALLVVLSLGLAILVASTLLKPLNAYMSFIDLNLGFQWSDFSLIFIVGLLTILLSTIYPAVVMSSFKPIHIIRGNLKMASGGKMIFRKILLLIQFSLVQLFVIGAIIIAVQMNHFRSSELGFSADAVVITPTPDVDKLDVCRNALLQDNRVSNVAFGSGPPMSVDGLSLGTTFRLPQQGIEEGQEAEMKIGDPNYLGFYDLKLLAGRPFTENKKSFDEFVVNERLLKSLDWTPEMAIGQKIAINEGEATIVGVVEDFHNHSLQHEITPCILMNWSYFQDKAFIRMHAGHEIPLTDIETLWKKTFPASVYSYSFLDDFIEKEYLLENLISSGVRIFSFLVLIIACLGIFGLMSLTISKKRKEAGIRKILGASLIQIVSAFSRDFILLVLLALLLVTPVIYLVAEGWLNGFTYRIDLSLWMFLGGGLLTILVVMLVSGSQTLKAALANPTETLRN